MPKRRADELMVTQGLAASLEEARLLIMAGRARTGTLTLVTPATMVEVGRAIELVERARFVSRGGEKLEAALQAFRIDVTGKRSLDIGASTGGFTDCLLQRGASSVLAVDVGKAQLHQKLREDHRVTLLEHTNARELPELPPIDFFAADVSFISLRRVLPSVAARVATGTPGVVLLKPQFEAEARDVPRGGVVRDEKVRAAVRDGFVQWAAGEGWQVRGVTDCPVAGGDGNVEFLVYIAAPGGC